MAGISVVTTQGTRVALQDDQLAALKSTLGDRLLTPGSRGYDEARTIWNAMIDRRPALIARCATTADVQQAVRVAAADNLLVSIKGGGHNIAGNALCDGGLMIDLSPMKRVEVDAEARTARVQPGVTLAELDAATQAHGLAVPLGINSTTGVAGLTLGGGFGWLTRKYGFTVDNLISAEIVTADGTLRRASEREHADLFWAIRGGGGNFGVVTSFEFRLHPVGPELYAGLVVYPFAQARKVLRAWRDFNATAPDELSVWAVLRKAPPLPFLPTSAHGTDVVVLPLVHSGDVESAERAAAPVLGFGEPIASHLGAMPYAGFQTAFDALLTAGGRNYWKSNNFRTLGDAALEVVIEAAAQSPGPECEIFVAQLGGAMARVAPDATAFVGRDAHYIMNVHGRWSDPRDDDKVRSWARRSFAAVAPHATGSGYVNFLTEDEGERVAASYGANHARLQALKTRYDPGNVFRMNLNIAPANGRAWRG